MTDQEWKELWEQNQASLLALDKKLTKVQNKLKWNTVWGLVKTVVIVTPLVWGAIYISPLLKNYVDIFSPMMQLFQITKEGPTALQNLRNTPLLNLEITPENREIICNAKTREAIIQQVCK